MIYKSEQTANKCLTQRHFIRTHQLLQKSNLCVFLCGMLPLTTKSPHCSRNSTHAELLGSNYLFTVAVWLYLFGWLTCLWRARHSFQVMKQDGESVFCFSFGICMRERDNVDTRRACMYTKTEACVVIETSSLPVRAVTLSIYLVICLSCFTKHWITSYKPLHTASYYIINV